MTRRWVTVLWLLSLFTPVLGWGQVVRISSMNTNSGYRNNDSITLSVTPSAVNFALTEGGTSNGSQAITISSTYTITSENHVMLYAYFTGNAALSSNTASIAASSLYGRCPTGNPTSYTAFTQTSPYSGSSALELYSVYTGGYGGGGSGSVSRSDSLYLQINLGTVSNLPAGTYTGTLVFQAEAL